ncbi:MAG: DNA repair protein RecN, partial [Gemmatimonadetes bacterium]|nr:DNA repair protein RecN [Gemmatimonadota bacterium]
FAEHGLLEAEELLVRRVITASGRSRVYLNGTLTTVALLRQLSAGLLHVYGQHEQQVLREADSALSLLDDFADTTQRVQEMATRYQTLRRAWERLRALTEDKEAAETRQDFVRFQVDEIHHAALRPGEEEELRQERTILVHAERLYQAASGGEAVLTESDSAVTDQLGRLVAQLRDLVQVDAGLNEAVSLLSDGLAQVEEAALFLRKYGERLSPNPERL